jgi:hypothetical protein
VRRNQADLFDDEEDFAVAPDKKEKQAGRRRVLSGRKIIRRGMEMLVGGVPINAESSLPTILVCAVLETSARPNQAWNARPVNQSWPTMDLALIF